MLGSLGRQTWSSEAFRSIKWTIAFFVIHKYGVFSKIYLSCPSQCFIIVIIIILD